MQEIKDIVQYVDVSLLKKSNKNPRIIKNRAFQLLCDSIKADPQFLEVRPILVDENYEIYAGNQRFAACLVLGWKKIPVVVTDIDEKKKEERMIRDNMHSGEFDFELLKDNFDNDMIKKIFDDEHIFDFLNDDSEEVSAVDPKYVEEMPLKNFENHDYLVFAFDNLQDFLYVAQKLGVEKVNCSFSPKTRKIGIGRVLDGKELVKLVRD